METNQVNFPPTGFANPLKRQVKFQFTWCELMTLYVLVADATSKKSPQHDMYAKLLHNIMAVVFKKLYSETTESKIVYIVEFSPMECLAFWLYWTDHPYPKDTLSGRILDRMNEIILMLFTT